MKTIEEILGLTAESRVTLLKSTATSAKNAQRTIAKILVAGEEKADFGPGEMNAYAQKITGLELRREFQGTYEAVNVLKGIRSGSVPMTEADFDRVLGFALVIISGLLSKSPEKVATACEIAVSGKDVTQRLKALKSPSKPKGAGDSEQEGDGAAPEIHPTVESSDTFVIPHDLPVLNHPELLQRLVSELRTCSGEDAETYLTILGKLTAMADSRLEELTAPAAAAA